MERRLSLRGRTDIPVLARDRWRISRVRGIEVSSTGIVVDRGHVITPREHGLLVGLSMVLPDSMRPLSAIARPVWSLGSQQALRFVDMSPVDRLNIAEHVDFLRRRGRQLH